MSKNVSKLDEKYRPKIFADLVGNQNIMKEIIEMAKNKNIPHLFFVGGAGTGKTSLSHVLANCLFKGDTIRKVLEKNASDENGIDVIREEIKNYAKYSKKQDNVDFRIVILDECDNMTPQAQQALRRTMEIYYKHCRFILICNYEWKVIEPIKSRCYICRFESITPDQMIPRLSYICENENIKIKPDALQYIAEKSNGDMRNALNNYLERLKLSKNEITIESLKKLKNDNSIIELMLKKGLNGHFVDCREKFLKLLKNGYNIRQVINEISDIAISNGFTDRMKGDIAYSCLQSEKLLLDGCTENLVIAGLVRRLIKIGEKY